MSSGWPLKGWEVVGRVRLRTTYWIAERQRGYVVRSRSRAGGQIYEEQIPKHHVRQLYRLLRDEECSVEDAVEMITHNLGRFSGLPYGYGYKLRFYAQRLLLILVAEDHATVHKAGRGYRYNIG